MLKIIIRSLVVGVGVGVLLAPRAGAETRRLLSDKLNRILDTTGNAVEDLSVRASDSGSWTPKQHSNDAGTEQPSEVESRPRPM